MYRAQVTLLRQKLRRSQHITNVFTIYNSFKASQQPLGIRITTAFASNKTVFVSEREHRTAQA
jgi:hypothetical protein